jgi:hypothetical protein
MKAFLVIGFIINLLASCVPNVPVTPPDAALPATYRGSSDPATSLAATPWQEIYDDPVLRTFRLRRRIKQFWRRRQTSRSTTANSNFKSTVSSRRR